MSWTQWTQHPAVSLPRPHPHPQGDHESVIFFPSLSSYLYSAGPTRGAERRGPFSGLCWPELLLLWKLCPHHLGHECISLSNVIVLKKKKILKRFFNFALESLGT